MTDLSAKYTKFTELLTDNLFRIPEYQRPYSWNNRQLEDLFGDIKKVNISGEPHFMATVVCLKKEEKKKVGSNELSVYEIVDGQQRLTSLIVLLKAIQLHFNQSQKKEKEEAYNLQNQVLVRGENDEKRLILLQTNHDESNIFDNYLRNGKHPSKGKLDTEPLKKLNNCFERCEEFVKKWNEDKDLIELLAIIKNKLGFIFYELNNEKTVYTVFEVLNSRGLPVIALDKTKCILMESIFNKYSSNNNDRQIYTDIIKNKWIEIYKIIGIKSISDDDIVKYAATLLLDKDKSKGKPLALDEALDIFRKLSEENLENTRCISDVLVDVAKYLKQLNSFPLYRFFYSITQVRFLYVSLFLNNQLSEEERNEIFWYWEKISFRIYGLMGNDAKKNVGDYIRLGRDIYHNDIENPYKQHEPDNKYDEFNAFNIKDKIIARLELIGESAPIKVAANRLKDNDCYKSWKDELRYFMFKYDCYLANNLTQKLENNQNWKKIFNESPIATIEHIFPQTPNDDWKGKMGQGNKIENYLNKIGNLLILPQRLNSQCKNKKFSEKRKIYEKALSEIVNDVIYENYNTNQKKQYLNDWNKDEIEKREKRLINVAKEIWK